MTENRLTVKKEGRVKEGLMAVLCGTWCKGKLVDGGRVQ